MTIARATVSGTVFRSPEKRFTQNNLPITSFALNISGKEDILVRVVLYGNLAETAANELHKGDSVVVEGRLQLASVQASNGAERKVMEINVSSFEKMTGGAVASNSTANNAGSKDKLVEFASEEFGDELIGDDEIPF